MHSLVPGNRPWTTTALQLQSSSHLQSDGMDLAETTFKKVQPYPEGNSWWLFLLFTIKYNHTYLIYGFQKPQLLLVAVDVAEQESEIKKCVRV